MKNDTDYLSFTCAEMKHLSDKTITPVIMEKKALKVTTIIKAVVIVLVSVVIFELIK